MQNALSFTIRMRKYKRLDILQNNTEVESARQKECAVCFGNSVEYILIVMLINIISGNDLTASVSLSVWIKNLSRRLNRIAEC